MPMGLASCSRLVDEVGACDDRTGSADVADVDQVVAEDACAPARRGRLLRVTGRDASSTLATTQRTPTGRPRTSADAVLERRAGGARRCPAGTAGSPGSRGRRCRRGPRPAGRRRSAAWLAGFRPMPATISGQRPRATRAARRTGAGARRCGRGAGAAGGRPARRPTGVRAGRSRAVPARGGWAGRGDRGAARARRQSGATGAAASAGGAVAGAWRVGRRRAQPRAPGATAAVRPDGPAAGSGVGRAPAAASEQRQLQLPAIAPEAAAAGVDRRSADARQRPASRARAAASARVGQRATTSAPAGASTTCSVKATQVAALGLERVEEPHAGEHVAVRRGRRRSASTVVLVGQAQQVADAVAPMSASAGRRAPGRASTRRRACRPRRAAR